MAVEMTLSFTEPLRRTIWQNIQGKRHVYPNVHRSTVYNSQDMEAT